MRRAKLDIDYLTVSDATGEAVLSSTDLNEHRRLLGQLRKRGGQAYYPYIVSTAGYRIEAVAPQKPPVDVLKEWLSANKREMRSASIEAFKKQLLVQAVEWRLK